MQAERRFKLQHIFSPTASKLNETTTKRWGFPGGKTYQTLAQSGGGVQVVRLLKAINEVPHGGQVLVDATTFASVNSIINDVSKMLAPRPDYESLTRCTPNRSTCASPACAASPCSDPTPWQPLHPSARGCTDPKYDLRHPPPFSPKSHHIWLLPHPDLHSHLTSFLSPSHQCPAVPLERRA